MNWLTNFVRPKLRALVARKEAPENLWLKCPKCEQMLFMRDWEANQEVCTHCGHHMRIRPLKRLPHLFDEGKYELHPLPKVPADPLKFRDTERYDARLKEAQAKAEGTTDALVVASGLMGSRMTVVAALDFGFMGGSMGTAVGEGLVMAAELAGRAQGAADRVLRLGRRAHAGRHPVADAAHPHHDRGAQGQGGGPALHRRADRSDDRRRVGLVRHAGRHPSRRARRHHRLRRPARDPGHHPPGAARGIPALGVPAGARHGRRGGASPQAARDADPHGHAADGSAGRRERCGRLEARP